MKKALCLVIALCIVISSAFLLASCRPNRMKDAIKNGDNYEIVASYDPETHTLSACQTVEATNRSGNSYTAVKFHIYANQYREGASSPVVPASYRQKAYPNGDSYGEITFDSVKVDGNAVAYVIEGSDMDILSVPMPNELYPDQKTTIELTYQITLANIKHRLGYTDETVNLGNFYPVLCQIENDNYVCSPYYNVGDPFVTDVANYNVSLTLPEKFVVASTGNLTEALPDNGNVTYKYQAQAVRDFAFVMSDKYQKLSQTVNNTQINYYYYNDQTAEESLAYACGTFEFLSKNVGEYPYAQYSVCETEFCYGGMEFPALTMISDKLPADGTVYTIVHENAHQWWYAMVGSDQLNCAWQDEGLAEYSSLMFFENHPNYSFTRTGIVGSATKAYRAYFSVYNQIFGEADTTMNRHLSKYESEYEYSNIAYNKGLIMFDMLRQSIGDDKFISALQEYFKDNIYKLASCDNLYASFLKHGDLEGFFASFIEGKIVI